MLLGLGILAVISMIFGMMAAVSQDLPAIYNFAQYKAQKNSEVVDSSGQPIGTLSSDQNKILLNSGADQPQHQERGGLDRGRPLLRTRRRRLPRHRPRAGRGRVSGTAQQGASTITEQFVKNALEAEGSRTVLEKFREAALAYKLEKHWSKEKILTEYLNTIYFGEGAYGIEAAAQTYFGAAHPGCGTEAEPCAAVLEPWEAAMIAGIIASPSAFDPKVNPEDALARRNLVLEKMVEQGYITRQQYNEGIHKALPAPADIKPPTLRIEAPYFTAFLRQQLVERYGAEKAYFGGLEVHSTLDLQLQEAAEEAVSSYLGYSPATASVVVIDNHTGGIKAMVGGPDFETAPFNLATQGRRQPGSSIKPFTLLTALEEGISPETEFPSEQRTFHFGANGEGNLHRPQRRRRLSGVLLDRLRPHLLRQLDLRRRWRWKGWKARRSRTAPARSPRRSTRRATPTRSRPTRRWRSAASRKASPRSAGPTPTRRSATTATASPAASRRAPATARSPSRSDQERQADQGRRKQADPPPGLQRGNRRRCRRGSWKR